MNILAIGPHPDDIEIGCSGTLIKYAQRGHGVFLLVITRGEKGGEAEARYEEQIKAAHQAGYVTTILNRRRYLPEIDSPNVSVKQFAERAAINTPIQGSAADLIKVAMLNIAKKFKENGIKSRMVLQVHDELVFEVKKDEAERVKKMVKKEMEGVFKLKVPILVHLGEGRNWLETED